MADAGRDNWSLSLRAGSRLTPALSRRALIFARELALYALVDQSESSHRLPSVSRSRFRGARRPRNLRSSRSRLGRDVDYVKYEPSWPELRWGRRNGTGGGREGKGPEKTGNARRCASRFCMRLLSGCESPSRALPLFLPVSFLPPPSLSLSLFFVILYPWAALLFRPDPAADGITREFYRRIPRASSVGRARILSSH